MDINEVNAGILKTGIGMYKAMLLIATNTAFSFDQTTDAQGHIAYEQFGPTQNERW